MYSQFFFLYNVIRTESGRKYKKFENQFKINWLECCILVSENITQLIKFRKFTIKVLRRLGFFVKLQLALLHGQELSSTRDGRSEKIII